MVAMPVGQRPEAQFLAWMQPKANIKGLAILIQSAPKAQCFTTSYALTILPQFGPDTFEEIPKVAQNRKVSAQSAAFLEIVKSTNSAADGKDSSQQVLVDRRIRLPHNQCANAKR